MQAGRQPNEKEKQTLRTAIEKDEKDTVARMIKQDGIDINADISLWYFWKASGQSVWKEALTWHYTPLHHAVTVKNLNMVQLLIKMGASITNDLISVNLKGSKSPLQRAIDSDSCEIVHFLVNECKQDISTFSRDEQRIIRAMIEEHECIKSEVKSDSSQDITDAKLYCVALSNKITTMYVELTNLHISFVLGELLANKVITLDEKQIIEQKPVEQKQIQYLLDRVILPSLKAHMSTKYMGFLEVMKRSKDLLHNEMAKRLSMDID